MEPRNREEEKRASKRRGVTVRWHTFTILQQHSLCYTYIQDTIPVEVMKSEEASQIKRLDVVLIAEMASDV